MINRDKLLIDAILASVGLESIKQPKISTTKKPVLKG